MFHLRNSPTQLPEIHTSFIISIPIRQSKGQTSRFISQKNEEQQTCNNHKDTSLVNNSLLITNHLVASLSLSHFETISKLLEILFKTYLQFNYASCQWSVELLILLSCFRIQHYATTLDSNCLTSNHVYTVFTVLSVMPLNILNKPLEKNTRVPGNTSSYP